MLVTVVLAAGKGTRMKSRLPKVLHHLLGEPILGHVLRATRTLRPDLEVVVVGHGREEIERAFEGQGFEGREIVWAVQEPQLGTGHAASCGIEAAAAAIGGGAAPATGGRAAADTGGGAAPATRRRAAAKPEGVDVLVVNGDLPLLRAETLQALVGRHRERGADATVLTCVKTDPTGYGRIIRDEAGRLREIIEEPDTDDRTRPLREINVGNYVFRIDAFRDGYSRIRRDNAQGELYLTDVPVSIARGGGNVETVSVEDEEEIAQVNSRAELARAADLLRADLIEEHQRNGVTIVDPRTTHLERDVRIGADTVIFPFTVIERDVEIGAGCEVGPFAHLRPGTRLADGTSIGNFVEIKNSRLGPGTKVRHLSYVGDGALGANVNVGAGTIFANFDGVRKNATVVEDDVSLGSGTVLVAPVRIGRGARTGAGAIVLRNRDVPPGALAVGMPAAPVRAKDSRSGSRGGRGAGRESKPSKDKDSARRGRNVRQASSPVRGRRRSRRATKTQRA